MLNYGYQIAKGLIKMTKTIIEFNEEVYNALESYRNVYNGAVRLREKASKLMELDPAAKFETKQLVFDTENHTVADELALFDDEIAGYVKHLKEIEDAVNFDIQYFIEMRNPRATIRFNNHLVSAHKIKDGGYRYKLENEESNDKETFETKEELIEQITKYYPYATTEHVSRLLKYLV